MVAISAEEALAAPAKTYPAAKKLAAGPVTVGDLVAGPVTTKPSVEKSPVVTGLAMEAALVV